MHVRFRFAVVILSTLAISAASPLPGPRVIGSEPSQEGQWLWQAALLKRFNDRSFAQIYCGSVAANDGVLTPLTA